MTTPSLPKLDNLVSAIRDNINNKLQNSINEIKGDINRLQGDVNTKANDNSVVHTSGDETVEGTKTFSSNIVGNVTGNCSGTAGGVAWANVSGKPSTYTPSSHTHDDRYYTESEVNNLLGGKSDTSHTHSNYLTGITKAMVTNALGYTPPTSDTNTTYSAGSNLSLSGTTFNVSSTPSFTSITIGGYTITID